MSLLFALCSRCLCLCLWCCVFALLCVVLRVCGVSLLVCVSVVLESYYFFLGGGRVS